MTHAAPARRVLLKFSGEALMGSNAFGIDPQILRGVADDIQTLARRGVQVAVVVGGGNIFRGAGLTASGIDRVTGDHMGMLATVMNALAIYDQLQRLDCPARVMSALSIASVCEDYSRHGAVEHLQQGRVVVFAAGTGNPFFTTDSAASLRAIETGCDLLVKATKVDGVYSADPFKDPQARRFSRLSYDEVIQRGLGVMDLAAVLLCRDHKLPLRVLDMLKPGALLRAVQGEDEGTLVQ